MASHPCQPDKDDEYGHSTYHCSSGKCPDSTALNCDQIHSHDHQSDDYIPTSQHPFDLIIGDDFTDDTIAQPSRAFGLRNDPMSRGAITPRSIIVAAISNAPNPTLPTCSNISMEPTTCEHGFEAPDEAPLELDDVQSYTYSTCHTHSHPTLSSTQHPPHDSSHVFSASPLNTISSHPPTCFSSPYPSFDTTPSLPPLFHTSTSNPFLTTSSSTSSSASSSLSKSPSSPASSSSLLAAAGAAAGVPLSLSAHLPRIPPLPPPSQVNWDMVNNALMQRLSRTLTWETWWWRLLGGSLVGVEVFAFFYLCWVLLVDVLLSGEYAYATNASWFFVTFHFFIALLLAISVASNFYLAVITDNAIPDCWSPPHPAYDGGRCVVCARIRPSRSVHCEMCGCCQLKRDHHSLFISNCVGLHNQQHYITFITTLLFFCIQAAILSYSALYPSPAPSSTSQDLPLPSSSPTNTHPLPLTFLCAITTLAIPILIFHMTVQITNLLRNRTAHEAKIGFVDSGLLLASTIPQVAAIPSSSTPSLYPCTSSKSCDITTASRSPSISHSMASSPSPSLPPPPSPSTSLSSISAIMNPFDLGCRDNFRQVYRQGLLPALFPLCLSRNNRGILRCCGKTISHSLFVRAPTLLSPSLASSCGCFPGLSRSETPTYLLANTTSTISRDAEDLESGISASSSSMVDISSLTSPFSFLSPPFSRPLPVITPLSPAALHAYRSLVHHPAHQHSQHPTSMIT